MIIRDKRKETEEVGLLCSISDQKLKFSFETCYLVVELLIGTMTTKEKKKGWHITKVPRSEKPDGLLL